MTSQHKELAEQLGKHRLEVSSLRTSLNELDRQKESWFGKKEELSGKIGESIRKIKDNKAKRDSLTQEVREFKSQRDSINKDISSKQKELDNLKKGKAGLVKSLGIKEPPSRIRQHIEKLEFRIETETVSFEKEKELMKNIRNLRKLHENASVIDDSNKKIKNAFGEIKGLRKKANEIHKAIQEKAAQSQVLHEGILKVSAEIDRLKAEEGEAFRKFSEFKRQFTDVNNRLKEKLREMNSVKGELDKIHFERKEKRRLEQESFLKSKEDAVNEKIRKREKLTTEDLLVFQKFDK